MSEQAEPFRRVVQSVVYDIDGFLSGQVVFAVVFIVGLHHTQYVPVVVGVPTHYGNLGSRRNVREQQVAVLTLSGPLLDAKPVEAVHSCTPNYTGP